MRISIAPHTIQIEAHCEPDKQWLPMAYKVTDAELELVVQDWPL